MSDENGINNRYAGFFTTERAGLDTLVFIGDEVLRNPAKADVDSVLKDWEKTAPRRIVYAIKKRSYRFSLLICYFADEFDAHQSEFFYIVIAIEFFEGFFSVS